MMGESAERLRFYLHTHIAKAVADSLRAQGVDVVRCQEVDLADASDAEHLAYTAREGRVMMTHDADFARLDSAWRATGKTHAGIMLVGSHLQGSQRIGELIRQLL